MKISINYAQFIAHLLLLACSSSAAAAAAAVAALVDVHQHRVQLTSYYCTTQYYFIFTRLLQSIYEGSGWATAAVRTTFAAEIPIGDPAAQIPGPIQDDFVVVAFRWKMIVFYAFPGTKWIFSIAARHNTTRATSWHRFQWIWLIRIQNRDASYY